MSDLSQLFQRLTLIERTARNTREFIAQAEVFRKSAERPSVAVIQNGTVKDDRGRAEGQFKQLSAMANHELGSLLHEAAALQADLQGGQPEVKLETRV